MAKIDSTQIFNTYFSDLCWRVMENKFTSQNPSVEDPLTTDAALNLSSILRQSQKKEPHSTEGVVKQHSCEQIFDKNSNIKQLKFSTSFTADGEPKGQNTWNVNFPTLSDSANFINWRTEDISDKSFEPASQNSSEQVTLDDTYDKGKKLWDKKLLFESNKRIVQTSTKSKYYMNDSSESQESTMSSPGIDSSSMDEVPELKTALDLLEIGLKRNINTARLENNNSKLPSVEPVLFKRRETIRPLRDKVPKLKTGLGSLFIPKRKLKLPGLMNVDLKLGDIEPQPLTSQEITQTPAPSNPCIKLIFFVLVGVIAAIISSLWNEINENPFDFTNASLELQKSIYGQDDAINQLIDHYNNNVKTLDVVVLVGGTGVGKSYAGKIITKHFPHKHNVFEYTPPLENDPGAAVNSLSSMHCNLVIFEHLKLNHLTDLVKYVKLLNSKKPKSCAMVLAMINPEIVNDNLTKTMNLEESLNEINETFSSVNIPIKTISFSPLTSDIIDICIKDEAKKNDIRLTDEQLQQIKRHLVLTNSGCKGAYAKVQLYART